MYYKHDKRGMDVYGEHYKDVLKCYIIMIMVFYCDKTPKTFKSTLEQW